jgi:hypothetical protein
MVESQISFRQASTAQGMLGLSIWQGGSSYLPTNGARSGLPFVVFLPDDSITSTSAR